MTEHTEASSAIDKLVAEGRELDGVLKVEANIAKTRRNVLALRIGSDELIEVSRAASAKGQTISEFIREAAINAARTGQTEQWLPAPLAKSLDELVQGYNALKADKKRRSRSTRARA